MFSYHWICLFCLVILSMLPGCNNNGVSSTAKQLEAGTPVRLIAEEGDFAIIETNDTEQYYVDLGLLKSRTTLTNEIEGQHTHVLSATTDAYLDDPPDVPAEQKPRSIEKISNEQTNLNRLYMTEKTQRQIIAPTNMGLFVDQVTGENVWPAYTCHNPDCPKKGTDDEPYLFVLFDRSKPPICPACVRAFQLSGAGQEELTPYLRWTRPYELEEKKRRVKQLDAERKRAYRALKQKLPRN